jgi:type IV secretion system protein VirD4
MILPALWLLFVIVTFVGAVRNGIPVVEDLLGIGRYHQADLFSGTGAEAIFLATRSSAPFAVCLWGLAAALFLGLVVVPNRRGWGNGKRFALGGIALAMMLGCSVGGGLLVLAMSFIAAPMWVSLLLAPFSLFVGGSIVIASIGTGALALFTFFIGVPVAIFNQIFAFEKAVNVYRYKTAGLTGYIVRFMRWLRNESAPPPLPDDSKGARFATGQEMVRLHAHNAPEAMAFDHLGDALFLRTLKHVLLMASTRSGKGVALIIPHLLRYVGSAFVLDPKGENARATGRRRAALNDIVHYLDPFGISGKPQSRFNPLSRFTPENMEAESKALAAALFLVSERERDHWNAAGQQLLAAIILYVYAAPEIPAAQKDLPCVRRILLGGIDDALNAMTESDAGDGLLRDLAVSFLKTPEKEFGSVVSTAQRQTEILDNPFIAACLSATGDAPEVDFKAWHTGTMTVYLCLSAPKFPVFNRWLRLVLTSALDEMTDTLNPPPLPVCFMLDELATLGHLAAVENAVGLSAGYGIQLVTVFQDTAQMKDLYKGRWASFIGNAGVRALFNLDDFDTAEYWSKFIGGRLVETRSQQQDIYGYTKGNNVSETMRPLLTPDEIMMDFASNKMLVLAQGAHPIVTDRVPYWMDRSLTGLWDDPRPGKGAKPKTQPPSPPANDAPASPPSPPPGPAPSSGSAQVGQAPNRPHPFQKRGSHGQGWGGQIIS